MTRPNVLLVTVDSLRADHVSACNPDAPVPTPGMDRVGDEGTTFTDAYAQGPFTTFSMPSLFTSRYPSGLDYVEISESVVGVYPPSDVVTLPEQLSQAGYATGGFHSNPLLSTLFDFDRGFDEFDADLPFASLSLPGRLRLLTNKLRRLLRKHAYLPAELVSRRAADWIEELDRDEPFFCWVHYMDVHGPYQSKEGFTYASKYRGERLWQKAVREPASITEAEHDELRATYAEEVAYTDENIGQLFDRVESATDRPTARVVTADHGDGFCEHGYYSHPHEVHEELVNVPLLVDGPAEGLPGGIVDAPAELIDVAPTVLEAVDLDVPEGYEGSTLVSGDNHVAISEGELVPDHRTALRTTEWTYVADEVRDERYLVDRGTGERVEESTATDAGAELADLLEAHRNRPAATGGETATQQIEDEEVRERLRRLGYVE